MNKKILLSIGVLSLMLAGCAAAQRSAVAPVEGYSEEAVYAEMPPGEPMAVEFDARFNSNTAQGSGRIVIKNAQLEIVVDTPDESMERIGQMAEEMGGFVVSANLFKTQTSDGQEIPQATITIRVPSENLDEAISRIEAESDRLPQRKDIQSQDITSEYTDLESRLKNLEAAESQLMEIMESANRTEDVLNVFDQLTRVREQIEVIKGQIKYYDESAKLSAISVDLIPNEAVQPISIAGWEPVGVVKNAIESLIVALQGLVNVVIWFGLFILPIILIIGIPLFFIIRGVKKWRARRKAAQETKAD
ncbi:MAG: DUF4349 domain-containing protein [Chloroflexota bacterium]|nr:MAG: DUF4349 domain-containing protein [Chloroflexota bacterium]